MALAEQQRRAITAALIDKCVVITGGPGVGKTTIIRCLLEQLPKHADVAMIMNPAASARDLLCSICDELAIDYLADETSLKILTDKLYEFLLTNHSKAAAESAMARLQQALDATNEAEARKSEAISFAPVKAVGPCVWH